MRHLGSVVAVWLAAGPLAGCVGEKVIYVDREVPVESDDGLSPLLDTGTTDGPNQDADGDGYTTDDCDDTDPNVNPGTVETCNGIDDDCDGTVDDVGAPPTWYADADADGHGVMGADRFVGCDAPEGYSASADDCDDARADVYPGAPTTICEAGLDADCDGKIDHADADSDGALSCEDCDDTDGAVFPGAPEVCNGVDDDCDGTADGAAALDATAWYADADADGYGSAATEQQACAAPSGFVDNLDDCDDTAAAVHPGATEVCDGIDNDCDGSADGADATDAVQFWADADADGYGDASIDTWACVAPTGFVSTADDCDDADPTVSPGATEVCGGSDEDCDGLIDDADASVTGTIVFYADSDADGFGAAAVQASACVAPRGYVTADTDCDDTDGSVHPGATEVCDGADNDCDGRTDDPTSADAATWYVDSDGDGWGGATTSVACTVPSGHTGLVGDCDDSDASVSPSAADTWYDGVDSDCAGDDDYDADADGDPSDAWGGGDCDDTDPTIGSTATETWYDGVDADCAGDDDYDADADGDRSDGWGGTDCDDSSALVFGGASETWYDGIDADCDGRSDYDADHDGFDSDLWGGDDCDDADALLHPYAWEDVTDGLDNDCDGDTDLADLDAPIDLGLGDDDDGAVELTVTTGWSIPFCGTDYSSFFLNGNGLLTFDVATTEYYETPTGLTSTYAPAVAVFWDDFDLSDSADANAYGVVYSDAVGIYFRSAEEYFGSATNDFGVVLFDDGRIFWDFGDMPVYDGIVGWSCGGGLGFEVDWSAERAVGTEGLPTVGTGTEAAMWQQFTYSDPMDLGDSTLWSCVQAGDDTDGDGWSDACGDPDDSDASVTP